MRPMVMFSTVPDGPVTRVTLEVFDADAPTGSKPLYRYNFDSARHPDSRPDWAAVYASRIVRTLAERLEQELAADGPSLSRPGAVRQMTIDRASRSWPSVGGSSGTSYM